MTFTIIDELTGKETTLDIENLDDLACLAVRFGYAKLEINMWDLIITVKA